MLTSLQQNLTVGEQQQEAEAQTVFYTNSSQEIRQPRTPLQHKPLALFEEEEDLIISFVENRPLNSPTAIMTSPKHHVKAPTTMDAIPEQPAEATAKSSSSKNLLSKFKPTSSKITVAGNSTVPGKTSKQHVFDKQAVGFELEENSAQVSIAPAPFNSGLQAPTALFEILVIPGKCGVGTHSLAARFVGQRLSEDDGTTKVTKFGDKFIPVKVYVGEEAMETPRYKKACGVVYVCDASDAEASVLAACQKKEIVDNFRAMWGLPPLYSVLLANKYDGGSRQRATEEQIRDMLGKADFDQVFCGSALTGLNVETAFNSIISAAASKPIVASHQPVDVMPTATISFPVMSSRPTSASSTKQRSSAASGARPASCVVS